MTQIEADSVDNEIDDNLDALLNVADNMHANAVATGQELEAQTAMAAGINDHMDETKVGIDGVTATVVETANRTKGGMAGCIIMVLLLILNVAFLFLPSF